MVPGSFRRGGRRSSASLPESLSEGVEHVQNLAVKPVAILEVEKQFLLSNRRNRLPH